MIGSIQDISGLLHAECSSAGASYRSARFGAERQLTDGLRAKLTMTATDRSGQAVRLQYLP